VVDEDVPGPLGASVVAFVEQERAPHQPAPNERSRVWFSRDSGVNSWSLGYEQDGDLCYIGFDQG
jgi:hypothetical protein